MPQYVIEIEGLEKLQNSFAQSPVMVIQQLALGIRTSVNIIRPIMREEAPMGTKMAGGGKSPGHPGLLRRSIFARSSGLEGAVGPDLVVTPYALFVHQGTNPYEIRPRTKKALFWSGAKHPVKMVRHPGIKANPFVERTAEKVSPVINRIFQGILNTITLKLIQ